MGCCARLTPSTPENIKGIISRGFGPCQPIAIIATKPNTAPTDNFCYLYHAHPEIHLIDDMVKRITAIPEEYINISIIHPETQYAFDSNLYRQIIRVTEILGGRNIRTIEHQLHNRGQVEEPPNVLDLS